MGSKETLFLSKLEEVKKLIEERKPNAEIARFVGVKYETLKTYFAKYGISYAGNPNRTGFVHEESRIPLSKILSNEVTYSNANLRKRLIECGLKENKCENPECGLTEWHGKPIVCELHHIDGNHYNNNLDNLQMLCPNCHSQTNSFRKTKNSIKKEEEKKDYTYVDEIAKKKQDKKMYSKKQKTEHIEKYCKHCGKKLSNNKKEFCDTECYNAYRAERSRRPNVLELIGVLKKYNNNLTAVGKHYGVSDNSVKKWKILYKI